eukprot:m.488704 g.488704  ORF g.488704 m.488704 type:complete len:81 (-) comp26026_c0_seq1:249-491(-)
MNSEIVDVSRSFESTIERKERLAREAREKAEAEAQAQQKLLMEQQSKENAVKHKQKLIAKGDRFLARMGRRQSEDVVVKI